MEFSRRHFLHVASAVSAVSAVPRRALALLGPALFDPAGKSSSFDGKQAHGPSGIRIGYAAITWGDDIAGAISDISSLGYRGIQLRANAVKLFPDPAVIKEKLTAANLIFT